MERSRSVCSRPLNMLDTADLCCRCLQQGHYLKMVPCGHLFCKDCLEPNTLTASQQNLLCPKCKTFGTSMYEFRGRGTGGVGNEPFGAIARDIERGVQAGEGDAVECHSCGTEVGGERSFFCVQCKVILCSSNQCLGDHTASNHYLILRSLSSVAPEPARQACSIHSLELQHVCLTCWQVVCESCITSDAHRRHKVESLSRAAERAKTSLQIASSHVEPAVCYMEWFYKDLRNARKAIQEKRQLVENQIRARAQEARDMIQEMENLAVTSLAHLSTDLEQQCLAEEGTVNDRLCGLRAKRDHLTSAILNDNEVTLVQMEPSALDTIQKPSVLRKFTSELPDSVQFPCDHSDSTATPLRTQVEKYIGCPRVQTTKRRAPAMNVVSELQVKLAESSAADTWKICSGGRGLLVWLSSSSLSHASAGAGIQLVNMSDLSVQVQQQLGELVGARVDLVNADHESAIACGKQQFFRLFKTRTEVIGHQQNIPFTVFCKGCLRACLRFSVYGCELLPSVNSLQDIWGEDAEGFNITRNGVPVSMDSNDSGQIFAVVNNHHQLSLYRRGSLKPFLTYPSAKAGSSPVRIRDVCFFKIGGQEVLLMADPAEDDVIALDVHRGCRVIGALTNRSGELSHPVALNVDPHTGWLLVLCSPPPPPPTEADTEGQGRLVVCGRTGVLLESRLSQALGSFAALSGVW